MNATTISTSGLSAPFFILSRSGPVRAATASVLIQWFFLPNRSRSSETKEARTDEGGMNIAASVAFGRSLDGLSLSLGERRNTKTVLPDRDCLIQ